MKSLIQTYLIGGGVVGLVLSLPDLHRQMDKIAGNVEIIHHQKTASWHEE
jgi:hypothetical protein